MIVESQGVPGKKPATGKPIKITAKGVVNFRVAKAAKDAMVPTGRASK